MDSGLSPDGLPRNDGANRVRQKSHFPKPFNMIVRFKTLAQK